MNNGERETVIFDGDLPNSTSTFDKTFHHYSTEPSSNLSVSAAHASISTVPYPIICDMFKRTEVLLSTDGLVNSQTGDNRWIIYSVRKQQHPLRTAREKKITVL